MTDTFLLKEVVPQVVTSPLSSPFSVISALCAVTEVLHQKYLINSNDKFLTAVAIAEEVTTILLGRDLISKEIYDRSIMIIQDTQILGELIREVIKISKESHLYQRRHSCSVS